MILRMSNELFERAHKWKNSIGQALWYGLQTNKKPGIVLILEDNSDFIYLQQLSSALKYAGLEEGITLLAWPYDFQN